MKFLISNDDGIYSPGLRTLAAVASKFGDVVIAAPDVEQSSMSQAITSSRPLRFRQASIEKFKAYRVDGTPSDCVALGIFNCPGIDVVLSGINLGTNIGSAIWHSGTLAAAKQAVLFNLRGIAFSVPVPETDHQAEPDWDTAAHWVEQALERLLPREDIRLANVNIPAKPKALHWTRQSIRQYDGKVVGAKDPQGRPLYWFTVVPITETEKGTDRWAMEHGFASMTPLRLDLTDEKLLAAAAAEPTVTKIVSRKRSRRRGRS